MSAGPWREDSRAGKASAEFHTMREEARKNGWEDQLNCFGHADQYVLYEVTPSKKRAEWLCAGCPLRVVCREYGLATKQAWGVWGGLTWDDGRRGEPSVKLAS